MRPQNRNMLSWAADIRFVDCKSNGRDSGAVFCLWLAHKVATRKDEQH